MLARDGTAATMMPPWAGQPDRHSFPALPVPAALLFCHPSRLANTYEPGIEKVRQEALLIPGGEALVTITRGCTPPPDRQQPAGWRERLAAPLISRLDAWRQGRPVRLGERLAYDARPVFNGNMAHLVQHHLAALGYLRERLGHGRDEVIVILEERPAKLAVEVFSLLGYEVLATGQPVDANLVEVRLEEFFHLLPWVRSLELPPGAAAGPRRLFIPRRGSRRLENEAEIGACLAAHGFEKIYFEDISIPEQWSLMGQATHIAAIHGAALGCLAFQAGRRGGPGARLLEFFGAGFVVNPFRKFMAVIGGTWAGCRGRITPAVARDIDRPGRAKAHAFDDFELAPAAVEAALAFLGTGDNR